MADEKKIVIKIQPSKTTPSTDNPDEKPEKVLAKENPTFLPRLEALSSQPRRNAALHWAAFGFSVISLTILVIWVSRFRENITLPWIMLDIVLGLFFVIEFFTRSGFRWDRRTYIRTRFFDFIAIVPALALVNHGFALEGVCVWIILIARVARAVDRLVGDGFVRRNAFALLEGLEEEITDRVLLRIMSRIQADLDRGNFANELAGVFVRNRDSVLERIRAENPHTGVAAGLAHIVGLDLVLEQTEERTYDAIVEIVKSQEVDHAVREGIDSMFSVMRQEMGAKTWKNHLGIRGKPS